MNSLGKLTIVVLAVMGAVVFLRHADSALHASVPKDMPQNAQFVQSGYDVSRNEAEGEWIACQAHAAEGDDWCRVTDQRGMVVFQGGFLPVSSSAPVPQSDLRVATADVDKMWVEGPFEAGPVPIIPLANGQVLVPETDREALATRWQNDPAQFQKVLNLR